jgi:hypothetical protein
MENHSMEIWEYNMDENRAETQRRGGGVKILSQAS